jgi:hypothetical protein
MMTPEQELARRIYRDAWSNVVRLTFNARRQSRSKKSLKYRRYDLNSMIIEHILLDHIDFYSVSELKLLTYRDWANTKFVFENNKTRYGGRVSWNIFQDMIKLYEKNETRLLGILAKTYLSEQIKSHYGAK